MRGKSLYDFPIHLGRGARAIEEPQFEGAEWYEDYAARHSDDLDEGRLVSLFRFEEPWTSWEMHPSGDDEVAVAFADPHGFLVLSYPVGYDANKLRRDLERAIKS